MYLPPDFKETKFPMTITSVCMLMVPRHLLTIRTATYELILIAESEKGYVITSTVSKSLSNEFQFKPFGALKIMKLTNESNRSFTSRK